MKNADMPAMPQTITDISDGQCLVGSHMEAEWQGLTKREMFAMHAMSAWIQHHGASRGYGFSEKEAAEDALRCADALLAELDK